MEFLKIWNRVCEQEHSSMKNILKIAATVLPFSGICLFLNRTNSKKEQMHILGSIRSFTYILCFTIFSVGSYGQDVQSIRDSLETLVKTRKYESCLKLAEESLVSYKDLDAYSRASLEYARCRCATSISTERADSYCSEMNNLKKELDLSNKKERDLYASMEKRNAQISYDRDNLQGRLDIIKGLLKTLEEYGDDVFELKAGMANTLRQMSDFDGMRALLDELEEDYKSLGIEDLSKEKMILGSRVQYANGIGDYALGRQYLERALEIGLSQDSFDHKYVRNQYNSLGINYFLSGDYSKSAYNLEKALEVITQVVEEKNVKALFNNLGLIYSKLNDYDRSNMFYEKSLKYDKMRYGENHTAIARTNFNIGVTNHERGDFKTSLEYLFKALEVRKALLGEEHSDVAHTYQIIGNSYYRLGAYEKAIAYIEKCLPIFEKKYNGKHQEIAWSNNVIAKSLAALGRFEEAKKAVDASYASIDFDPDKPLEHIRDLDAPHVIYSPLSTDLSISIGQYEKTKDISALEEVDKKEEIFNALFSFLTRNRDASVRRAQAPTVKLIKGRIIERNYLQYKETGDKEYLARIFHTMEKSKNTFLTETKVEKDMLSFSGVPKSLLEEQGAIVDSIAELQFAISKLESGTDEYVQTQLRITEFKDQQEQILVKLEKEFPNYYNLKYEFPVCSLEDLQAFCAEGDHWLNYFWGEKYIYLFSTKSTGSEVYKIAQVEEIDSSLQKFQDAILDKSVEGVLKKHAEQLYATLVAPAQAKEGERLKLVLDDKLGSIPYEVLQNSNGQFLLETNPIQYFLSSTLALDPFKGSERTRGTMICAPHFEGEKEITKQYALSLENEVLRGELATLKGAAKEADMIHSLLGGTSLKGPMAKESTFKKNAHKYSILHLATHGIMDERKPNYSKLAFAQDEEGEDGFLHAYEIYGLSLNADLVNLSACNTGSGSSKAEEGIASLGRAFAYAGCPNSVMSLWNVNDQSTAELMSLFYKNINKGSNKSDALRDAKLEFLKTQPKAFQSPFYWAGFVYYGDNLPLELSNSFFGTKGWLIGLFGLGLLFFFWFMKKGK